MSTKLILFYDGGCPLCVREMRHLKSLDEGKHLQFESIWAADFAERFPEVDVAEANQILHGKASNGQMLYGLDVTYAAWSAVGRGWLIAPLRWPGIRWFADKGYLSFAKHRNRLSKLITGKARCEQCSLDE
ncbi:thiol-disulfide oxidoreductase DCC family protein [Pseudidiomarina sp. E22-M8]|uniref:thiol-disulfide oxidoreductase DCC family protein n=1 Tax=Pseudidiomarina sp. E22-M8 TaxID=3424768 RepID=UPI00403C04B9